MNKFDEDKIKKLIHSIGLKYNLQDEIINKILVSQFKFAREKISELSLREIENEDEFNKLKLNFNYLHIGKLYISLEKLLMINKKFKLKNGRE